MSADQMGGRVLVRAFPVMDREMRAVAWLMAGGRAVVNPTMSRAMEVGRPDVQETPVQGSMLEQGSGNDALQVSREEGLPS